jgi:hypothetical protein
MLNRRVNRLEATVWQRVKARFDAMSEEEVIAWLDGYCGVAAREWVLSYMDTLPAEELAELATPPDPYNPAQQRFSQAWERWLETQP